MEFGTLLELIVSVIDLFDALGRRFTEGRDYRQKRFGRVRGELAYWLGLLNTEEIQRTHFNINFWSKDEATAWKDAYVSRCSAICVASAIFASIGQSALSLDGVRDAHWSAGALLSASMALGTLSVVAAVSLQNNVTSLSNHKEIRLWLSKGLSQHYYDYPEPYHSLLLESSASTIKLMEAPNILLNLSVVTYFLGFGLYLLYSWIWAVVDSPLSYRNNFIFYVCTLGGVLAYIALLASGRLMDRDRVNQQFNLKQRFDTGTVDKKMEMLERWTEIVEVMTSSKSESEKVTARQAMDDVLYFMRFGEKPSSVEAGKLSEQQSSCPATQ